MSMIKAFYIAADACRILTTIIVNGVFGIVIKPSRLSYKQNFLFNSLKALRRCYVIGRDIDLNGTHTVYKQFVEKHNLPYRTTPLGSAELLWLGPENEHVVYWLHGGAYVRPAVSGHFLMMQRSGVQVAALKYSLAPNKQYPTQLEEAVAGLKYLLQHFRSDQITIIGDSAGGNLALGLMSHLMHPHPSLPALELADLASLILISPWVNFTNDSITWQQNLNTDFMLPDGLNAASSGFLGSHPVDKYNQPIDAPPEWWRALPAKTVRITYGKLEVFAADIIKFGQNMKASGYDKDIQIVGFEGEAHDQSAIGATVGWPQQKSEKVVGHWISEAANAQH